MITRIRDGVYYYEKVDPPIRMEMAYRGFGKVNFFRRVQNWMARQKWRRLHNYGSTSGGAWVFLAEGRSK